MSRLIVTRAMLERALRVTGELPESAMVTAVAIQKNPEGTASVLVDYTSPLPADRPPPMKREPGAFLELFPEADPTLVTRFVAFHAENPFIYLRFVELAFRMRRAGRKKYGAQKIIHVIRWDYDISTEGDVFEINNDFIALYARLAIADYPELGGFFELRRMKPFDRRMSEEELRRRSELAE